MKKVILAALLGTVVVTPVLAAPYDRHDGRGRFETQRTVTKKVVIRHDDRRHDYRRWNRGQRFDVRQAPRYRVIGNPGYYHLRAAPRGYRWVQSGNDAVMVAIASGIVAAVMANAIG